MPYESKEAQLEYQRKWRNARREAFIAEFGGKCEKCGSTEGLQFDHKNPAEKTSHRIFSWTLERARAELLKCQLLCRACHQEKSVAEQGHPPREHGTNLMYMRGKCRCQPCRTAHAKVNAAYRAGLFGGGE